MIDLAVVGGGPVGLMTAIRARLAGLDVVVLEQRAGAVDKACGEGLMPEALAMLAQVGVDPDGATLAGIRYVQDARSVEARFRAGVGRGVRRTTLHAALSDRAHELGATVVHRKAVDVREVEGGVAVDDLRARYVVAADGLHSSVRSCVGLASTARGPARYGVRRHLRAAPWTDLVEVHWTPTAELYVTPVAEDLVGVAVLGPRPLSFEAALESVPGLAARLRDAPADGDDRGAGPLRQRVPARRAGRVLLVGDAAGYVDALTGEGLRVGFATAGAAVAAVADDNPRRYDAEWRRITRQYRLLTGGLLRAATTPGARRLVVPSARAAPWVFQRAVDALAGSGAVGAPAHQR